MPTEETTTTTTTPPAPAQQSGDVTIAMMREMQADVRRLETDHRTATTTVAERDRTITEMKAKLDGYAAAEQTAARKTKEDAIVTQVKAAYPHAGDLAVRGVIAAMHESGKIDRYSDKADDTAKVAIELIKTDAPNLALAPMAGGGTNGLQRSPGTGGFRSLI